MGGVPGALGTENLAKVTGLNDVGFFEPARAWSLLSARLASDSEPPCEAVSSPISDPDVTPFISSARAATGTGAYFEVSWVSFSML